MHERILEELRRIERDQNVRVLHACESGSRAWGWAQYRSSDIGHSDYDVRFIFARPADEYLRLNPPRDTIEIAIEPDLDLSGWDIYKTCHLLRKTNPALLEWLASPIVYCETHSVTDVLRSESKAHFNMRACCEHYLSMAKSNYQNYIRDRERIRVKKYLYALRPMICLLWLLRHKSFPPTEFAQVLNGVELDTPLRRAIDELIASKAGRRERAAVAPVTVFEQFLTQRLAELPLQLPKLPSTPFPTDRLDAMLLDLLLARSMNAIE